MLVAFLGNDKESWGQVSALINRGTWDKVLIVKSKDSEDFPLEATTIKIDTKQTISELKEDIISKLKEKLSSELEVALSIAAGNGKEHMALISALLTIPVGIRLVAYTKKGLEYIN